MLNTCAHKQHFALFLLYWSQRIFSKNWPDLREKYFMSNLKMGSASNEKYKNSRTAVWQSIFIRFRLLIGASLVSLFLASFKVSSKTDSFRPKNERKKWTRHFFCHFFSPSSPIMSSNKFIFYLLRILDVYNTYICTNTL